MKALSRRPQHAKRPRVDHFRDDVGILNEFALMYDLKDSFPLHYVIFRQVACHLPHEANTAGW